MRRLLFLSFGHIITDFYPGLLAPLLPFLRERIGLTYAGAGFLVMILQIFCNITQPLFGILNDRRPMRHFLWLGLIFSGLPFCCLFSLREVKFIAIALAVSGMGVGMFHPVAVAAANLTAREDHKARAMALFSSGGLIGLMAAPLAIVFIFELLGESYFPFIILPACITALYFLFDRGMIVSIGHTLSVREWFTTFMENGWDLFVLWLISSMRAVVYMILSSFLPLLVIARGASTIESSFILSASLFAGMIGMFVGGHLSDIHSPRRVMAMTLLLSSPLLFGFLLTHGILSLILLCGANAVISSSIPINIVLAQKAATHHSGTAASLIMGLSFVIGALVSPPFGALADSVGIESAMIVIPIIPIAGAFSVLLLRKGK